MRTILGAIAVAVGLGLTAASAADLKITKAPPKPAPYVALDWTGFYLGGHAGYLWGRTRAEEDGVLIEAGAPTDGFVGGVLGGFNWQSGAWVFGIEADIGWSDAHGAGREEPDVVSSPNQYDIRWTSHARVRFGQLFGQTLLFIAGGLSIADFKFTEGDATPVVTVGQTFTGGSIGGGIEHAFDPWWRARVEYIYDDFGSKTYVNAEGESYRVDLTGHTVRGAITRKLP
jgi:outer membrane immunogenic protein